MSKIRYRVKPLDVLQQVILKEGVYNHADITNRRDFVYKGFGFSGVMWSLCGREIHNIERREDDPWFCRGLGYKWHEDWVEPIIEYTTEDIDE